MRRSQVLAGPWTSATTTAVSSRYQVVHGGELYPVVVNGRTFLMHLTHASIGWRLYPDWIIVLYASGGDGVEPVASVIVEATRGPLADVRVTAP